MLTKKRPCYWYFKEEIRNPEQSPEQILISSVVSLLSEGGGETKTLKYLSKLSCCQIVSFKALFTFFQFYVTVTVILLENNHLRGTLEISRELTCVPLTEGKYIKISVLKGIWLHILLF